MYPCKSFPKDEADEAALLGPLEADDPPLDPPGPFLAPPPTPSSPSLEAVSLLEPELTPLELLTLVPPPPPPPPPLPPLPMTERPLVMMGMDLTEPARLLVQRVPLGPTLRLEESRQRLEARMLARMLCLLPRRTGREKTSHG